MKLRQIFESEEDDRAGHEAMFYQMPKEHQDWCLKSVTFFKDRHLSSMMKTNHGWDVAKPGTTFVIKGASTKNIPFQIDTCYDSFSIVDTGITTLKNCPRTIHGHLTIADNDELLEVDYLPDTVAYNVKIYGNNIRDFKNIHKKIGKITSGKVVVGNNVQSHMLDWLKVEGNIKEIDFANVYVQNNHFHEVKKVCEILTKYLGQGLKGIAQAQRELIENDLDDYAEMG